MTLLHPHLLSSLDSTASSAACSSVATLSVHFLLLFLAVATTLAAFCLCGVVASGAARDSLGCRFYTWKSTGLRTLDTTNSPTSLVKMKWCLLDSIKWVKIALPLLASAWPSMRHAMWVLLEAKQASWFRNRRVTRTKGSYLLPRAVTRQFWLTFHLNILISTQTFWVCQLQLFVLYLQLWFWFCGT